MIKDNPKVVDSEIKGNRMLILNGRIVGKKWRRELDANTIA